MQNLVANFFCRIVDFFTIVDVDLSLLSLQTDLFYYGIYSFNGMWKEEGVKNMIRSDIFAY